MIAPTLDTSGQAGHSDGRPVVFFWRAHIMHRRVLAKTTAMIFSVILFASPMMGPAWAAADGDVNAKTAGADLFGLTKVVKLHIEISAEEYEAMQPPAPAGFRRAPASPAAEASGRARERAKPLWSRVSVGARGR